MGDHGRAGICNTGVRTVYGPMSPDRINGQHRISRERSQRVARNRFPALRSGPARTTSGERDPRALSGAARGRRVRGARLTNYVCNTPILNSRVAGLWLAASLPMLINGPPAYLLGAMVCPKEHHSSQGGWMST